MIAPHPVPVCSMTLQARASCYPSMTGTARAQWHLCLSPLSDCGDAKGTSLPELASSSGPGMNEANI